MREYKIECLFSSGLSLFPPPGKEFMREERIKKFLIPVIVSAVTSLLIDGIRALLPLILQ
jgi:hypothetical protein